MITHTIDVLTGAIGLIAVAGVLGVLHPVLVLLLVLTALPELIHIVMVLGYVQGLSQHRHRLLRTSRTRQRLTQQALLQCAPRARPTRWWYYTACSSSGTARSGSPPPIAEPPVRRTSV
ncbi:hypothetical protein F4561_006338 [Lipingzhangella halophila]|uniref:Uncharacterized protein n=2 Tax=Lipingzhangella halophila TaxID=1783352 RepID=A0A7W7W6Y4_9ACTN|nr:hypothetical protein [Lipingzhangella halophila]